MTDGVVIRVAEGCAADSNALWDSVWDAERGFADWAMSDPDETQNHGGLRAKQAIATAVVLCLFTDKRVPDDHPCAWLADGDKRGYWGDGIDVRADLNETELGSLLWLLERAPMTISGTPAETWAVQFANEALATLLAQGVCARINVTATANVAAGIIALTVDLFARDGSKTFNENFSVLWNQVG